MSDAGLNYVMLGNVLDGTKQILDIENGTIDIQTVNGFGNLSDGTWQINNNGVAKFGNPIGGVGVEIDPEGTIQSVGGPYSTFFTSYPTGGQILMGDFDEVIGKTKYLLDDNTQTQSFNANNGFAFGTLTGGIIMYRADGDNFSYFEAGSPTGNPFVHMGDLSGQGNQTTFYLDDNAETQRFNAFNGFQFRGGSTISSDGDLSLMMGNAGIFSNGEFHTYDVVNSMRIFETSNAGDLYMHDSNGVTTMQTDGHGQLIVSNKDTLLNTFLVDDYNMLVKNTVDEVIYMYVDADGIIEVKNSQNNACTLRADKNGIQTVDAIAGAATLSPSWLLGGVTLGAPTLTTPVYINTMIGGIPTQIQAFQ